MKSMSLAEILSPIPVEKFINNYFGNKSLLVRGEPGKFDALFEPSAFIHRLDQAPEIRCIFKELRQAVIFPKDVKEMYESGATICVSGIDRCHKSLRSAAKRIKKEIGYAGRIDFRAYLSPPGSGFDIHYDARVATTLQLEGTKTWSYSDEPRKPFPNHNSSRGEMAKNRELASASKLHTATLLPGDLLCLPPGAWHEAQAGPGGSLALNMAFNYTGATVLDVLIRELRESVRSSPGCCEPYFAGSSELSDERLKKSIKQCINALTSAMQDVEDKARTRKGLKKFL